MGLSADGSEDVALDKVTGKLPRAYLYVNPSKEPDLSQGLPLRKICFHYRFMCYSMAFPCDYPKVYLAVRSQVASFGGKGARAEMP